LQRLEHRSRAASPNAVAQADASLERHRKLFTWRHITEADYMREVERLTELRDQLRGAAMIRPTVRVKGVDDLWAPIERNRATSAAGRDVRPLDHQRRRDRQFRATS